MLKLLWRDFQDKCIISKKKYLIACTVISFLYKREKIKLYRFAFTSQRTVKRLPGR